MYSSEDFSMYYANTWVKLPDKSYGFVVEVNVNTVLLRKPDGQMVASPLAALTNWDSLKWPELGWRSVGEDGVPVYLYSHAQGQAKKGFNKARLKYFNPLPVGFTQPGQIVLLPSDVFSPEFTPLTAAIESVFNALNLSRLLSRNSIVIADPVSETPKLNVYYRRALIGTVGESGTVEFNTSLKRSFEEELNSWL